MAFISSAPIIVASQGKDQIYMYFAVKYNTKFIHFVNFHGRTLEQMFQGNVWMCLYQEKHVGMRQEPNHVGNWVFYSLALTLSQTVQSSTATYSLEACVFVCSIWVSIHICAHVHIGQESALRVSSQSLRTLPCMVKFLSEAGVQSYCQGGCQQDQDSSWYHSPSTGSKVFLHFRLFL